MSSDSRFESAEGVPRLLGAGRLAGSGGFGDETSGGFVVATADTNAADGRGMTLGLESRFGGLPSLQRRTLVIIFKR
ncbi:MAG: hypothetical protein SFX72_00225, partial [Isosphaeraceae bacterium]|nr:hypothetical protein [Isosphaeraceae bacterium]